MKIKTLFGGILVKPEKEEATSTGIIFYKAFDEEPHKGIIIQSDYAFLPVGSGVIWKDLRGTWVDDCIIIDVRDCVALYDRRGGENNNKNSQKSSKRLLKS